MTDNGLPRARNFEDFLRKKGVFKVKELPAGGSNVRNYIIIVDDEKIGTYTEYLTGNTRRRTAKRQTYRGRIPGFEYEFGLEIRSELRLVCNNDRDKGHKRHDGWRDIPFP